MDQERRRAKRSAWPRWKMRYEDSYDKSNKRVCTTRKDWTTNHKATQKNVLLNSSDILKSLLTIFNHKTNTKCVRDCSVFHLSIAQKSFSRRIPHRTTQLKWAGSRVLRGCICALRPLNRSIQTELLPLSEWANRRKGKHSTNREKSQTRRKKNTT